MLTDARKAYEIPKRILEPVGFWPEKKESTTVKVKRVIFWWLSLVGTLTTLPEILRNITQFVKLYKILYLMIPLLAYFFRLSAFLVKGGDLLKTIDHLSDPLLLYPEKYDGHMQKAMKVATFIGKAFSRTCAVCAVLITVAPAFDNKMILPTPEELKDDYYVVYFIQAVTVSLAALINSSFDVLTVGLILVAAAHFDIVGNEIRDFKELSLKQGHDKIEDTLKRLVLHHIAVIDLVKLIETTISSGIIVLFLSTIIAICNTIFFIILEPATSAFFAILILYLILVLSELFMLCWFGNEIIVKSRDVGEACYFAPWYTCDPATSKYLFIIMERSRRRININIMNLSDLSLVSFSSIIQWAYSYFTVLLKLYKKEKRS